jgi:hypothetical protein
MAGSGRRPALQGMDFSSALQESWLLADLTQVPESKLLEMLARARSFAADETARLECEWIKQELDERVRSAERQFGIDMVPEIDGWHGL